MQALVYTCEYPKYIVNRRYSSLDPALRRVYSHRPDYWLKIPCGRCFLCKKRRASQWKVRITKEVEFTRTHHHYGKILPRIVFCTFTFAQQFYTDNDDVFAPWLKKFRDNFRKAFGRSPRYIAVTDRGSQFGRLHLHMLLFDPRYYDKQVKEYTHDISISELRRHNNLWWSFGFVDATWVKKYGVSEYISGYISNQNMYKEERTKHGKPICEKALKYMPKVFPSKGLGAAFLDQRQAELLDKSNYRSIQLNGYNYGVPRYYLLKSFDLLYPHYKVETFSGEWKEHRPDYDWFIYHRLWLNHLQEREYMYEHKFDLSSFKVRYNGKDMLYSLFESAKAITKDYITPSTPKYIGNVFLTNDFASEFVHELQFFNYGDVIYKLSPYWQDYPPIDLTKRTY